jgi:hypothetical protein
MRSTFVDKGDLVATTLECFVHDLLSSSVTDGLVG